MKLRNSHEYGAEPYETKRLRLRSNAEDPRPGIDLHDDRFDRFDPATDAWPPCALPESALTGSCRNPADFVSLDRGDAAGCSNSAAGGLGGNRLPVARPSREAA